jgi:hypothetical protein
MKVEFVADRQNISSTGGFRETVGGVATHFERVSGAVISLVIDRPITSRALSYRAMRDAVKTDVSPSFPGQQHSADIQRTFKKVIHGRAKLFGLGEQFSTSVSILGSENQFREINVRLEGAKNNGGKYVTGFCFDYFDKDCQEPHGGFEFYGCISGYDIDYLINELRSLGGPLVLNVSIGLFPGFFGEKYVDGWSGGKIKYVDREICKSVVENFASIPEDFFEPNDPFNSRIFSSGPHDLVEMIAVYR